MKKALKIVLVMFCCLTMLVTLLAACQTAMVTVIFDPNYEGAVLLPQKGKIGTTFEAPTVRRNGYTFEGWYDNKEFDGPSWEFPLKVLTDVTFYAKWQQDVVEPDPEPEVVVLSRITAHYAEPHINLGEQPDVSLLTVTAHYSDGSSKIVTNFSVGTVDSTTAGEKQWQISYTEDGITKSVTIEIRVSDGIVDDMSIHFLELGNNSNGDCIYIKAGDTDILIDAGSSAGSATTIQSYVDQYCTDGTLEYVIVTHADTDHIAAFTRSLNSGGGIFEMYQCETIIDFARTGKNTTTLKTYIERRDAEVEAGAVHYTALQCYNEEDGAQRVYELADGITMEILYQKYYETSTSNENDYSVCLMFTHGENHYLFLGDLEEAGEKSLVENNPNLPEVELYKAGHHGSPTSANEVLLKVIKPKYVCICCVAGHTEYTQNLENTFPSQAFIDRIAPYTDNVYATTWGHIKLSSNGRWNSDGYESMNGNIVFSCINGVIEVHGTNNDTKLKDTQWFQEYRNCPDAWKNTNVD